MPKCYICDSEIKQEMMLNAHDNLIMGFYAIVVRNTQIAICGDCFKLWNRVLELLLSRFKEQKRIDEEICRKILEENE
jgi:hypothetical protein